MYCSLKENERTYFVLLDNFCLNSMYDCDRYLLFSSAIKHNFVTGYPSTYVLYLLSGANSFSRFVDNNHISYTCNRGEFTPGFQWDSCCSIFSFMCMFCRSLFFLLAIVLSFLRFMDSDSPHWYLQALLILFCHILFKNKFKKKPLRPVSSPQHQ